MSRANKASVVSRVHAGLLVNKVSKGHAAMKDPSVSRVNAA